MKEDFLQYVWEYSLFDFSSLITSEGKKIIIHKLGVRNTNSGPDFLNSEITIDNIRWVGNVEIHINSSDWKVHKHFLDASYDNVILHVVMNNISSVKTSKNREIPTLEMKEIIFENTNNNYQKLIKSEDYPICNSQISEVDKSIIYIQMEGVLEERLDKKSEIVKQMLDKTKNDWDSVLYSLILKSFGMKVNENPMEMLSRFLPYSIIRKHKNNLEQLNALFFGVSAFLNSAKDDYSLSLKKEYDYLKHKYNLEEMEISSWKFLRLRPANFPTIRLAQLSALFFNNESLFSIIKDQKSVKETQKLFDLELEKYWDTHYILDKVSVLKKKKLGKSTIDVIIINAIVPLFYHYGKVHTSFSDFSVKLLGEVKSEKNKVVSKFSKFPIQLDSAAKSQSLIHLYNEYCSQKKCLNCDIGIQILKHNEII